jgi:hypothetical protein
VSDAEIEAKVELARHGCRGSIRPADRCGLVARPRLDAGTSFGPPEHVHRADRQVRADHRINAGLGFAIAQALAARIWHRTQRNRAGTGKAAARDALAPSSGGVIISGPTSRIAQIERLVAAATARFGGVGIW